MARDYNNDVYWRAKYPSQRVALGMLGTMGFRNIDAVKFCAEHFSDIRTEKGQIPTLAAFRSRMDHGARYVSEMKWIQKNKPWHFKRGLRIVPAIMGFLLDRGIDPILQVMKSPASSAHVSTAVNKQSKAIKNLEAKIDRPRGDKRNITT